MTNRKKFIAIITILFLTALLTSCVYYRFLKVKNQLSQFEEHFVIEEKEGLTLKFLKPQLLTKDIVWLMSTEPISKEKNEDGEIWYYTLEKKYLKRKNESANFDIQIKMSFQKNKLTEVTLPKKFLKYFSKPLFEKMLSSFGEAKISKTKKKASSEFKGSNSAEIPTTKEIGIVLGKPYYNKFDENLKTFVYKYRIKSPDPQKKPGLKITYRFDKKTDYLQRVEGSIKGLKIYMDFTKIEKSASN